MSNPMSWQKWIHRKYLQCLHWKERNPHVFLVLTIFGLTSLIMWFNWYWVPERVVAAFLARGYTLEEALVLQGSYGDMFGSISSLFSGIAMVAAISAIVLQSFEFSAQREELSLQRSEMVTANQMNSERLAFDQSNQAYQRRLVLIEQIAEMERLPLREHIERLVVLQRIEKLETVTLKCLTNTLPGGSWKLRGLASSAKRVLESTEEQYEAMLSAFAVLEFLHRVHLSEWTRKEFANFAPFILTHMDALDPIVQIVRQQKETPAPVWTVSFPLLSMEANMMHQEGEIEGLLGR